MEENKQNWRHNRAKRNIGRFFHNVFNKIAHDDLGYSLGVYVPRDKDDFVDGTIMKGFKGMYGERLKCVNKKYSDIILFKKKENDKKKVTYYCNGPIEFEGITDTGTTNIENIIDCLLEVIPEELKNLSKEEKLKEYKFCIRIKGHSRGAVVASIFRKELRKKIKGIDELKDRIIGLSLTQLDPVPGPSLVSSRHKYGSDYEAFNVEDENESEKSAVVFSVDPKGVVLNPSFTMQKALGHKVIVITEENHAVGTEMVDFDDGIPKKQLYTYKKNNKKVKIKDLDSGIYYVYAKEITVETAI